MFSQEKKFFSEVGHVELPIPDLLEIQKVSYQYFLSHGIQDVLKEFSPSFDYSGNVKLEFSKPYVSNVKVTETEAYLKEKTYECSIRCKIHITDTHTNVTQTEDLFLLDLPAMTDRGSFIINGTEKVVVPQLLRSPGAYFTFEQYGERRLFGAKVIPARGSWLEFQTEPTNVITVKINRKRKALATLLLKVFGFDSSEELLKAFGDLAPDELEFIQATLKKDQTLNREEALVEMHHLLKPTEPAVIENALALANDLFDLTPETSQSLGKVRRYDLSGPGRFKMNARLSRTSKSLGLDREDLVAIVREIAKRNDKLTSVADDIDSLENRRLKVVGELLEERVRVGMQRFIKNVRDKMAVAGGSEDATKAAFNTRPITNAVREFFNLSPLVQFLDQINILSEIEAKRTNTVAGPGGVNRQRAGSSIRDTHPSHYGRICPIQTSEGGNAGIKSYLSMYTQPNEMGFLLTPYYKVEKGKVSHDIVNLTATEEKDQVIAEGVTSVEHGAITDEYVAARTSDGPRIVHRSEVTLMDVASSQIASVSAALIPFLEHDDCNRALMGANMQKQAVPLLVSEAPFVGTNVQHAAMEYSGRVVLAKNPGTVAAVDAFRIAIKGEHGEDRYELQKFIGTNQSTVLNQKPVVTLGAKVKQGDIIADVSGVDRGVMALGKNILVAFMPFFGLGFEDAIVVSERLLREDTFTSVHIESFPVEVRDTRLGAEMTTADIPGIPDVRLRNLDEQGIIRIGAEVQPQDILVGKLTPKKETELSPEEKLLRTVFGQSFSEFKDTSLYLPHGKEGRVVGVQMLSRDQGDALEASVIKRIKVNVAKLKKLQAGDKLVGRHGNKGVISKILAVEDMPYMEDGTPIDVILNPLGVMSRMNFGQILETHLGMAAHKLGYRAIVQSMAAPAEELVKEELKHAGYKENGKFPLYDGRSGERFGGEVTVGYMYMMKLNHIAEDKIHARSTGPYSLITQQPLGGKTHFGGQRVGEMETWALEAHGAANVLQEILTVKSDDVLGRNQVYSSIIKGQPIRTPNVPNVFGILVQELRALGFAVDIQESGERERVPAPEPRPVTKAE